MDPFYDRRPATVRGQIPADLAGKPASKLVAKIGDLDDDKAQELINFGCLWLEGLLLTEPERPLIADQDFRFNWPRYGPKRFYEADPLRIVYEDEGLLVYDKESGRPAQGAPYDAYNNVLAALNRLTGLRLRLPHRLDAGTSGYLLLAKNHEAASHIAQQFAQGLVKKMYLALAKGPPPPPEEHLVTAYLAKLGPNYVARVNGPGKAAKTLVKPLDREEDVTLGGAWTLTGRTHQSRLHLAFLGYPILGDGQYCGPLGPRLALRAMGLAFRRPLSNELLSFGPEEEELKSLWAADL